MVTVAQGKLLPATKEFSQMAITFALAAFAWIFFRTENIHHALDYIYGIFSSLLFSTPQMVLK